MEDSVRLDVENRICDEQGPRPDSYLRPQLVAFHTMKEVTIDMYCCLADSYCISHASLD